MAATPDRDLLIAYWITPPGAPLGACFGVSAYSRSDAQELLREAGIEVDLALPEVIVKEGITFAELDAKHIVPNMGPMQFRGVWYPQMNLRNRGR